MKQGESYFQRCPFRVWGILPQHHQEVKFSYGRFCFSYQVSKTLHNSLYHVEPSLDVCLYNNKKSIRKIFVFHRAMIFTSKRIRTFNTDTLRFKPKHGPKPRLRRKILTFATGNVFPQNFFYLKDMDHEKLFSSKVCVQHRALPRYEK
jgi:hypothetical protein